MRTYVRLLATVWRHRKATLATTSPRRLALRSWTPGSRVSRPTIQRREAARVCSRCRARGRSAQWMTIQRERERGWAAACHSCISRSLQRLDFYSFSSPIPVLLHSQAHARRVLVHAAPLELVRTHHGRRKRRSLTCGGRRVSQRRRRHGQRALPSGYLRQVVTRLIGNSLCGVGGDDRMSVRDSPSQTKESVWSADRPEGLGPKE
eukprot:COSAG06_NODE_19559_length_832_cov_5.193724_1_plen_206_part_00